MRSEELENSRPGPTMTTIICEGFDRCPRCKQVPPPGTTADSYKHHVEQCGIL